MACVTSGCLSLFHLLVLSLSPMRLCVSVSLTLRAPHLSCTHNARGRFARAVDAGAYGRPVNWLGGGKKRVYWPLFLKKKRVYGRVGWGRRGYFHKTTNKRQELMSAGKSSSLVCFTSISLSYISLSRVARESVVYWYSIQ